jgi:hypothetical protein
MTADVTIADDVANSMTLNVEIWDYDIARAPNVFSMGRVPSLGSPSNIATDFGSYLEIYSLIGWLDGRDDVKTLMGYAEDEWFENPPLVLTIPAMADLDDDAVDVKPSGSNASPAVQYCRTWHDLEQQGPGEYKFEIRMPVVRKL